jgi:hypothetical protein
MKRIIWSIVCLGLVAGLAGCEVDGGEDTDAGADAGQDTGGDDGITECTEAGLAVYEASCVSTFFSGCYDPSGTCDVSETTDTTTGVVSTDVTFSNGAAWETTRLDIDENGTTTVVASDGTVCAEDTDVVTTSSSARAVTFTSGADTLVIEFDASGNMVVTCPDGTDEVYQAVDGEGIQLATCAGFACDGTFY